VIGDRERFPEQDAAVAPVRVQAIEQVDDGQDRGGHNHRLHCTAPTSAAVEQ